MKLKIPPVLTVVIFGFMVWGLDQLIYPEWSLFMVNLWIYRFIFSMGCALICLAFIQFIRHKTTVDPHNLQKATSLVSGGIYRISRNPMYLAMFIFLFAFGLKLGNILAFLLLPFFVWYMNAFQIKHEEVAMQQKFGSAYAEYKNKCAGGSKSVAGCGRSCPYREREC